MIEDWKRLEPYAAIGAIGVGLYALYAWAETRKAANSANAAANAALTAEYTPQSAPGIPNIPILQLENVASIAFTVGQDQALTSPLSGTGGMLSNSPGMALTTNQVPTVPSWLTLNEALTPSLAPSPLGPGSELGIQ